MRKFLIALIFIGCAYLIFRAAYSVPKWQLPTVMRATPGANLPVGEEMAKPPFDPGERYIFFYTMGPLRAGSARLSFVGEATTPDGKEAFLVSFESKVGTFYDLENIYAEKQTFYPLYIERAIRNFSLATSIKEKYDQENFKVEITKQGILGKKATLIEKKSPVQNAILLIYYCRRLPVSELKPGYEFDIVLPVDEFKVRLTKTEKIKVPAGTFQAYLFESSPEKIRLWISCDDKHTPLKMENLTSFGPSSIVLEKQAAA